LRFHSQMKPAEKIFLDHVSLIELLGDAEARDSVLDNPRLVDAILSNAGHLSSLRILIS